MDLRTHDGLRALAEGHAWLERETFIVERFLEKAARSSERKSATARILFFLAEVSSMLQEDAREEESALDGTPEGVRIHVEHIALRQLVRDVGARVLDAEVEAGFRSLGEWTRILIQALRRHLVHEEQDLFDHFQEAHGIPSTFVRDGSAATLRRSIA